MLQTSQGYIFYILQHLTTNFSIFSDLEYLECSGNEHSIFFPSNFVPNVSGTLKDFCPAWVSEHLIYWGTNIALVTSLIYFRFFKNCNNIAPCFASQYFNKYCVVKTLSINELFPLRKRK